MDRIEVLKTRLSIFGYSRYVKIKNNDGTKWYLNLFRIGGSEIPERRQFKRATEAKKHGEKFERRYKRLLRAAIDSMETDQ